MSRQQGGEIGHEQVYQVHFESFADRLGVMISVKAEREKEQHTRSLYKVAKNPVLAVNLRCAGGDLLESDLLGTSKVVHARPAMRRVRLEVPGGGTVLPMRFGNSPGAPVKLLA